jgi:hypothetical protein
VVGSRRDLPAGSWDPARDLDDDGHETFAVLVLEGLLTREHCVDDRVAADLLGPGDVLEAHRDVTLTLPDELRWTASAPTSVALLDERFLAGARHWPVLCARLSERLAAQNARLARHAAIAALGRVELRVLGMLWHLAGTWGRVSPGGIIVPLRLTHEALGRLVGAQRSTVTLALSALAAGGAVARRSDGTFLLREGSQAWLAPGERTLRGTEPTAVELVAPTITPLAGPGEDARLEALRTEIERLRGAAQQRRRDLATTLERSRETLERSRRMREDARSRRAERPRA